ncbi:hypothetical protein BTVI_146349 [Pitangus sulphuratus]|nr:hypothetical protein BTVI_146349 [Pitangus sulphuratus]
MQPRSPALSGPGHQPVLNPVRSAPVQALGCQLFQECAMGDGVKCFAEVLVDVSTAFPSSTRQVTTLEGDQVSSHVSFYFVTTVNSVELLKRLYENASIQMCLLEIPETAGIDALKVVASCARDVK